jgi:hypothetical protein
MVEKIGIVTGLLVKLSKKDQSCDRFEGNARKAVKIKPEL